MPEILPAVIKKIEAGQALVDQQSQAVIALARELGYDGPTSAAALMDGARSAKRRVGMAIMEFGAYLLLIKAGCAHGEFGAALAELEIVPDTARTYMALSRRFAKRASTPVLEGLGFGKAAELLPLDDEQIDELAELGQTGELALDDVARMSLKELRAAVRKERGVKERLEAVNKELNNELLAKRGAKLSRRNWPQAFDSLRNQAHVALGDIEKSICLLDGIRAAAIEDEAADDADEESLAQARAALADQVAAGYHRVHGALEGFANLFNQTLGAFSTGDAL